ncbi:MAG: metal ABC transporter substrate-binding protein [Dermatophilaceae bacterium]
MPRHLVSAATIAAVLTLAACGSSEASPSAGDKSAPGSPSPTAPALAVAAAFYPVQWVSEQVGGDLVEVTGLTKPGGEPHDLELTPKAVAELGESDVVVYLRGFQPAVDSAVDTQAASTAYDVTADANLSVAVTEPEHAGHEHAADEKEKAVGDEEHRDGVGPDGTKDPHFWLDPQRLATVTTALGERFAAADAANAATYRTNATALVAQLRALDTEFDTGLAQCAITDLVTGHAAFAYLAERYGFAQEGIAGVSPDAEPDAATIRELAEHVKEHGVSTVYSETLVDPALAQTVARETGAKVAVLDPIEGLTDASAGKDYLEVMRSNLTTLRTGQECT